MSNKSVIIESIELDGFIGVKQGLGKDNLFIDLSAGGLYAILGNNGKGKSTIMGALTPYRESFVNHRKPVPNGTRAYKIIKIRIEDNLYEIRHDWFEKYAGKTSFILNGVELNEGLSVRMGEDLIATHIAPKDYFKLGQLGQKVTNFISLSPGQRKDFVRENFLNSAVEEFEKLFEQAREKFQQLTTTKDYCTTQLMKYESSAILKSNIKSLEDNIKLSEGEKDEEIKKEATKDNELKSLGDYELTKTALSKHNSDLLTEEATQSTLQNNVNLLLSKFDYESYNETKAQEFIAAEKIKYNTATTSISGLQQQLNDKEELLKENEGELGTYDTINLDVYKTQLTDYNKQLSTIVNNEEYIRLSKVFGDVEQHTVATYKKFILNSKDNFNELNSLSKLTNTPYTTIEEVGMMISKLEDYIYKEADNLQLAESHIDRLTGVVEQLEKDKSNEDIISKRPTNCGIDTCPFIAHVLKFKGTGQLYEDKLAELTKVESYRDTQKEKVDDLPKPSDYRNILQYRMIRESTIPEQFYDINGIGSYDEFILKLINDEMFANSNMYYNDAVNYESYIVHVAKLNQLILSVNNTISNKTKNSKVVEKLEQIIQKTKDEIDVLNGQYNTHKTDADAAKEQYGLAEGIQEDNVVYKNAKEDLVIQGGAIKDLADAVLTFSGNLTKMENILEDKKTHKTNIDKYNIEIQGYRNTLQELSTKLDNVNSFTTQLTELEEDYEDVKIIRDALNPKKGLINEFIVNFMNKNQDNVNELVKMGTNGKFAIKFEVNSKDFYINVLSNTGDFKRDVNACSGGETTIINLSLSLSLIENFSTDYSVLMLDEFDSTLDADNRQIFLKLLTKQMDNMNSKQAFVITHNDEVLNYPGLNAIILSDNINVANFDNVIKLYE